MLEVWSVLATFRDALTLIGGSAPPLLVEDDRADPYIGTLDVDAVVDPLEVPEETYRSIAEELRRRGYRQDARQPYRWYRLVNIDEQQVEVELDLLAPMTDRSGSSHRHERIDGEPLARRLPGAELTRDHYVTREIEGELPDGRPNRVKIRIATAGVIVVLKALALDGRDEPKDSYDIDYLLAHHPEGVDGVAREITALGDLEPVRGALAILARKFSSVTSYGPASVALYRGAPEGSASAAVFDPDAFDPASFQVSASRLTAPEVRALAYARVQRLLQVVTASDRGRT